MSEPFIGYNPERENRSKFLMLPKAQQLMTFKGQYTEVKLDPREIMQVENQGNVGACFTPDMKVNTINKGKIPIVEVEAGDRVQTHTRLVQNVLSSTNRLFTGQLFTLYLEDLTVIRCTEDHLIRVCVQEAGLGNGLPEDIQWVRADALQQFDRVISPLVKAATINGQCSEGRLTSIDYIKSESVTNLRVYCLNVDVDNSFLCEDIIVHNCQGHSLSSVTEWCRAIATGKVTQLSRAMGYYETQRIDGLLGKDDGSTIDGGRELVMSIGLCEEKLWPYTGKYQPQRPANWDAVVENAAFNKLAKAFAVQQYEEGRIFLGSGMGGLHMGIAWGAGMDTDKVETFRPGNGGHAICALCLGEEVDKNGDPYWWIMNSWSKQFGSRKYPGWQCWSPTAIKQMLAHKWTTMIALSDMPNLKPRIFTPGDWKKVLKPWG